LLPPQCRCLEKYLSNGSCENTSAGTWHWGYWVVLGPVQWMRALQIQVHSHSSPNIHVHACTHIDLVPVIRRPCNVSLLRQVFRFSLALPGALSASSSHSFRYVKKSSDSHYRNNIMHVSWHCVRTQFSSVMFLPSSFILWANHCTSFDLLHWNLPNGSTITTTWCAHSQVVPWCVYQVGWRLWLGVAKWVLR